MAEASIDFINLVTENTELTELGIETEEDGEENEEEFEKITFKDTNGGHVTLASKYSNSQINLTYLMTLKYESIALGVIAPPPDHTI